MSGEPADIFLEELLQSAVGRLDNALDEEDARWLKARLVEQMMADPTLQPLVKAALPRQVDVSGQRPKALLFGEEPMIFPVKQAQGEKK